MTPFDLDRIGGHRALSALVDEILACGELGIDLFRTGAAAQVEHKADESPVTVADKKIEARLRSFMATRFPSLGFLGEESGGSETPSNEMRFIVDPIDGTRAFMRGLHSWSILVGIEADGEPSVGIAFMPVTGDLFVGVRGAGATLNGRPLQVSKTRSLHEAAITHGALRQFTDAGWERALLPLAKGTHTQRGFGDFEGYKYVLQGKLDAMIDPAVHAWDLCVPYVLVREAGGRMSALDGRETLYAGHGVASNGFIHDELVKLIASAV